MMISKDFKPKTIEAFSDDGTMYPVTFRLFAPGDEIGMMECVRDEYRESYFKRFFYDPDGIRKQASEGNYVFFVAEYEEQIIAIYILTLFHEDGDNYIEPASCIVRRAYRGLQLATLMTDIIMPYAESLEPDSLFVHAVTFHKSIQEIIEAYGYVPVGFRLGSFLAVNMSNSYDVSLCDKYSEGILIYPVKKRDAGKIFLPAEIADYVCMLYDKLGAAYEAENLDFERAVAKYDPVFDGLDEKAKLSVNRDDLQKTFVIKVEKSGRDIQAAMKELTGRYESEGMWTIQIELSISSPAVFFEYEELKKAGFFFSSLKPLCGTDEKIYMQWTGSLDLKTENYVLTDSFEELRRKIEKYHSETKGSSNGD